MAHQKIIDEAISEVEETVLLPKAASIYGGAGRVGVFLPIGVKPDQVVDLSTGYSQNIYSEEYVYELQSFWRDPEADVDDKTEAWMLDYDTRLP